MSKKKLTGMRPVVQSIGGTIGSDPEVFIRKEGKIVPSSKLIPEKGFDLLNMADPDKKHKHYPLMRRNAIYSGTKLVRDGVQAEIQTAILISCRQTFSDNLLSALITLENIALSQGMEVSYDPVVELTDEEWDSLKPAERMLGCSPSLNIYRESPILVDQDTYRVRSAGGHLHLGGTYMQSSYNKMGLEWSRLIAICDLMLGIPSVMLDRSAQGLRRQTYGRAGEYRIQPHGVEYRTLSNYWLRGYTLTSLIWTLMRTANALNMGKQFVEDDEWGGNNNKDEWAPDFLSQFEAPDVQKAINENDYALAKQIWARVEEWFLKVGVGAAVFGNEYDFKALQAIIDWGLDSLWPTPEAGWKVFKAQANAGLYKDTYGWESAREVLNRSTTYWDSLGVELPQQSLKEAA